MNESQAALELMEPASPEALLPDHGLWQWPAAITALLLLIAVIAFLIWKLSRPRPETRYALREAAYRDALAAIDSIDCEQARAAAVQASLILRKYLATAAADPALFETHEEFLSREDALQALFPDTRTAAAAGFSRLASCKYAPDDPNETASAIVAESRELLQTLHSGFAS